MEKLIHTLAHTKRIYFYPIKKSNFRALVKVVVMLIKEFTRV